MGITHLDSYRSLNGTHQGRSNSLDISIKYDLHAALGLLKTFYRPISYQINNREVTVINNRRLIRRSRKRQLSFDFMDVPFQNNVILLVPRNKLGYLCYGVYDMFRTYDAKLAEASLLLEDCGYKTIGDLVQEQEQTLREFPFMNDDLINKMKEGLGLMGLRLGLIIPARSHSGYVSTSTNGRSR
jgi:hypothetical protein